MTFVLEQKADLSSFPGWEGCYVTVSQLTPKEALAWASIEKEEDVEKQFATIVNMMREHLVGGVGWNGKEQVPITKDNVGDLPISILKHIAGFLAGNSNESSVKPKS